MTAERLVPVEAAVRAQHNLIDQIRRNGWTTSQQVADGLSLVELLAALAHPPAQGSESGGEVERVLREGWAEEAFNAGHTVSGLRWEHTSDETKDRYQDYVGRRLQAALSPQPGPASEGDGE